MRKSAALALIAIILLLNACKKTNSTNSTSIQNPTPIPASTIDAFIKQQLLDNHKFEWSTASDEMIWSALQLSDKVLSIGYKPAAETNVEDKLATINIADANWKAAKQQVLQLVLKNESANKEEWAENILPVMDIKVENLATV